MRCTKLSRLGVLLPAAETFLIQGNSVLGPGADKRRRDKRPRQGQEPVILSCARTASGTLGSWLPGLRPVSDPVVWRVKPGAQGDTAGSAARGTSGPWNNVPPGSYAVSSDVRLHRGCSRCGPAVRTSSSDRSFTQKRCRLYLVPPSLSLLSRCGFGSRWDCVLPLAPFCRTCPSVSPTAGPSSAGGRPRSRSWL